MAATANNTQRRLAPHRRSWAKFAEEFPEHCRQSSLDSRDFFPPMGVDVDQAGISSVQSFDRLDRQGDTRDSRDPLPVFFLQEALVSSSSMGRDIHSLTLSIQQFLCQPQRRPPSKVPRKMCLERLSWRVTCRPNHVSFRLLTVTRRRRFLCNPPGS